MLNQKKLDIKMLNKLDSMLKIASVTNTISRSAGNYRSVTAPTIEGYTFLCWFNVASSGWLSSLTIENATNTTTKVWNTITNGSGQGNFIAYALYVKD